MRTSCRNEQGAVTAFVVVFSLTLLLVAGLVIDGGYILSSRRQAISEAESAARAGAQALERQTPVNTRVNDTVARQAVDAYLAKTGHNGTVRVNADLVTVEVSFDRPMTILGLGGLKSTTIHGRGTARPATGIVAEGDL